MAGEAYLPAGMVLDDRFTILEVLGRGGFGCAYLAEDGSRGDRCVVKELMPPGAFRDDCGILHLPNETAAHTLRLRQRFIEEAKLASRLNAPGILPVRAVFAEMGSAYFVTDYLEGCQSLQEKLDESGRIEADQAEAIFRSLLASLAAIHAQGVLHRDIKPSNILLSAKGRAYLIDFGAAREWHADTESRHTVLFTPGYCPPEQLSESARRGPATDLYALCATMYHALSGSAPIASTERVAGFPLVELADLRPDLPRSLVDAVDFGLRLPYAERPQNAETLLRILDQEAVHDQTDDILLSFDERAKKLQHLRFQKFECPACHGVLEVPRPLRKKQCPVCREGAIQERRMDPNLCPVCRESPMVVKQNLDPLTVCPICAVGQLHSQKAGFFSKQRRWRCGECESAFEVEGGAWALIENRGQEVPEARRRRLSPHEWRAESGRAETYSLCRGCGAQLDHLVDGRRTLKVPERSGRFHTLYADEWMRVAANLPPSGGNAECSSCGADYFVEGEAVTLVAAELDPFHFAERYLGRLMTFEQLRWLGVGKESAQEGLVCADCLTEFDRDGNYLRLIQSTHVRLLARAGHPHTLEDWHRIAQDLPLAAQEREFEHDFDLALIEAYETGQIGLEDRKSEGVIWRGHAERFTVSEDGERTMHGEATLAMTASEATHGGMLRKWRVPLDAILNVESQDDDVLLTISGEVEPIGFLVQPIELTAHLESGPRSVRLNAHSLASRLRHERGLD